MKFVDSNVIVKAYTDNDDKEQCRKVPFEDLEIKRVEP